MQLTPDFYETLYDGERAPFFRIEVSQKHIDSGVPVEPKHCPIAVALQDRFSRQFYVSPIGIHLLDKYGDKKIYEINPYDEEAVVNFMESFDAREDGVKPFSFQVDFDDLKEALEWENCCSCDVLMDGTEQYPDESEDGQCGGCKTATCQSCNNDVFRDEDGQFPVYCDVCENLPTCEKCDQRFSEESLPPWYTYDHFDEVTICGDCVNPDDFPDED